MGLTISFMEHYTLSYRARTTQGLLLTLLLFLSLFTCLSLPSRADEPIRLVVWGLESGVRRQKARMPK